MNTADNQKLDANNYPYVSVIILTYNGNEYIGPLLESLLNQSYPQDRTEILVVDNASTDDTLTTIGTSFPSVKVVALEQNYGFAAGNNQALMHASHDLLVFLNQDTICHPGFLQSMVALMEANNTLAACNPNILTPEVEGFGNMDPGFETESLYFYDLMPFGYGQNRIVDGKNVSRSKLLSGCAFIIRRETISNMGYLFDEQLWMYAEDTDLSLRLHNMAQNICVTREAIVYHLHKTSMQIEKRRILTAAGAIKNRVFAYYKNMSGIEFFFFFPFLFLGGLFKILAFPISPGRKAIFFLPFGIFSMACMLAAVFQMTRFEGKKRTIMKQRRIPDFALLKLILRRG